MLDSLTRLLRRRLPALSDSRLMEGWARDRGETLKHARNGRGSVVEYRCHGYAARLEWGPPQRDYIRHRELRVRVELGLPVALEMLVMSRHLAEALEAQAYDQLTRDQQTEIDASMPEEARWLAMFEPVQLADAADFNRGFVVLAASPTHARRWTTGDLASCLSRARASWLPAEVPFVLMTLRGRLYLRTEVRALDHNLLDGISQLVGIAAGRALRVASRAPRANDGSETGIAAMCQPGAESGLHPMLVEDPGMSAEEVISQFDEQMLTSFGVETATDVKV